MSKWSETTLDVLKEIHLDNKNVRLEVADSKIEADIMEDLFANEDTLNLVDGICKVGYLTHEIPIAIKRGNKYVMVEGNRRLAALKAIQNPLLVPDYQNRVAALATLISDRSTLAKIQVKIAPSQAEADQLIAAIHTGNLRRPWTPVRQAAFFQAQIDSGRTLKELIVRYPTIDVKEFVFKARILNLFKSVEYDDSDLKSFLITKKWARGLSTLDRIYGSKEFMTLTGLKMDAEGHVTKTVSDETFKGMATAIVQGMLDGNIDTRSLNSVKSPRFTLLMNELRAIQAEGVESDQEADHSQKRQPVSPSGPPAAAVATQDGAKGPTKSNTEVAVSVSKSPANSQRGRRKKQQWLDLGQIKAPDNYPEAFKLLLSELSAIDVQRFANATFLVVRAVLEKSIKSFAEAKSIDIKGTGINDNGRVQLGHTLTWLLQHVKAHGPTYLIQPIEGVRTGKLVTYTTTSDALNAANHNHHFKVDPDEVFAMWGSIDSIMRYLMKP